MPHADSPSPDLLLLGFDPRTASELVADPRLEGLETAHVDAPGALRAGVVAFGPGIPPAEIAATIVRAESPAATRFLVLAAGPDPSPFEPLVEDDLLFYLSPELPATADVTALLAAATGRAAAPTDAFEPAPEVLRKLTELEEERELAGAVDAVEKAAASLVPCRRAECLLVDAPTRTFFRPDAEEDAARNSSVVGITGFVAVTGSVVEASRSDEDPRYDSDSDLDGRVAREQLLVLPLGAGSATEGVLAVSRGARQDPFEGLERRRLEAFAREAGPILRRRRWAAEQARVESREQIYRSRALAHRNQGLETRSEPLRVAPAWIGTAYRGVLAALLLGLCALPFVGHDELAVGPAVVRLKGRLEVRAPTAGVLAQVHVRPGDAVRAGQELARLESAREEADLERLRQELELRLVERLRRPDRADVASSAAFISLREEQRVATARLEALRLRAPEPGVVGDLLALPGARLDPGRPVISLASSVETGEDTGPSVEVLLAGKYRPLLEPGMDVRLRLDGYQDFERVVPVAEVSRRLITPDQARELVGSTLGLGTEPQVIVRAELPGEFFSSRDRRFPFYDGMTGTAEIRVRKKRFISDWLHKVWQRRPRP